MKDSPIYYVVRLHESCSEETANFIIDTLQGKAGLDLTSSASPTGGLVLHVSSSQKKINSIAKYELALKKYDREGIHRVFDGDSPEFSSVELNISEIQQCILFAMESIHFDKSVKVLPGTRVSMLLKGNSVIASFKEAGLLEVFPYHFEEKLQKLYSKWSSINPPIKEIQEYFGSNVALYFSFTTFYTAFLFPISALGVLSYVFEKIFALQFLQVRIFFAAANLIAVSLFLELWKRRSNEHAHDWGTGGKLRHKRPRSGYRGETSIINPISGQFEPHYPMRKTLAKALFVSFPLTLLSLLIAALLLCASFESEIFFESFFGSDSLFTYCPSILYSLIIFVFNRLYLKLAHTLTEWENHRTQEQFERWVVIKLIVFEFINSFGSLFYIAFALENKELLRNCVLSQLVVSQLGNQISESLLPLVFKSKSTRKVLHRLSPSSGPLSHPKALDSLNKIPLTSEMSINWKKESFDSTYDDLLELWLQFGHVFMFNSCIPLAAPLALLNNLIELRIDSYKYCVFMRKPTPRSIRDIGAWETAFNLTSLLSIISNLSLCALDPDLRSQYELSSSHWILLFVFLEHIFLLLRFGINKMIPDISTDVKKAMDREDHILKKEK